MRRFGVLVTAWWLCWGVASRAGEPPRAARWIPAEHAILSVEIVRPESLIDNLTSERLQTLLKAVPRYQKALEGEPYKQARDVAQFLAGALDTTPEKAVRDLAGGNLFLAVEGRDRPERVYLFVTPRDPAFLERAHAKLLELARQDASNKGNPDPVQQTQYQGVTAYSASTQEAHAIADGLLVVANGGEALKTMIDRIQGREAVKAPLADDETWTARRAAIDPQAAAWSLVRLDRLRKIDPKRFAPEKIEPGPLFLLGPWIESAARADWIASSFTWTSTRATAEAVMPLAVSNEKLVSAYLPGPGQGASRPPRPPGTIASLSLWRDLSAVWEARGEIFPPEAQQGFAQLDTFAGQFFGGRDFGSGVLGAIGTDWRLVVARQDPSTLDPRPEVLTPAFAIVIDLKDEDPDFGVRLEAAFQSFVGLVNLGAAQSKAPPLMLGSESLDGTTITVARFQTSRNRPDDEPVHIRHNFSPSAVRFDNHFVLSSSAALARDLVRTLREPSPPTDATILLEADGRELSQLIAQDREYLVNQNVLEQGNDRGQAEAEIDLLRQLVEYLGHATYSATRADGLLRLRLHHDLAP
jgi:hypothetical protein